MSVPKTGRPDPPPIPKIYYDGRRYAMESRGKYIPLTEGAVKAHLRQAGVEADALEAHLCRIREKKYVGFMGAVAGFPPGLHRAEDSGQKILVTTGPEIIEGKPGKFPFLRSFLRGLLDDPVQPEQYRNVWAWMAQARRNLTDGVRRPLPALVLVGPVEAGKSLFIELMRQVLGGRCASALAVLKGTTAFNADCVASELLTVDDETASRDPRMRVAFAQGIKRHFFGGAVRHEAKYGGAITLRPIQALIVAVNDEPESLRVLPLLDKSLSDKITLVKCAKATLEGLDDRDEIAARMRAELPALIAKLEAYTIRAEHHNQRTGVKVWQHPRVLELLYEGSPEGQFQELLLACHALTTVMKQKGEWAGRASELQVLLFEDPATRRVARSLLIYGKTCGELLGKLRASGRADIGRSLLHGITRWKIRSLAK